MMKRLQRFWQALDDLPGAAADAMEWRERAGEEWRYVAPWLRSTGRLAKSVSCPSPGGDNCPRRVVEVSDRHFRAVCGQSPAECATLDLLQSDIAIFSVDRLEIGRALARALRLDGDVSVKNDCVTLGRHGVTAGAFIDVQLLLRREPENFTPLEDTVAGTGTSAFVVPTVRSINDGAAKRLTATGNLLILLSEETVSRDEGALEFRTPVEILLDPIRKRLLDKEKERRVWVLPPGVEWGELVFELAEAEVVTIRFRREVRSFDPGQLRMRDKRNGTLTRAWGFFVVMAAAGGVLTWQDSDADSTFVKRKQELGKILVEAFGIKTPPISWHDGAYRTAFSIRDGRVLAVRRSNG